jgi:hypothetical protein
MSDNHDRPTMSGPEAGRRFWGLGRAASYRAAKAGDMPCVRLGGRLFASVPAIEQMLANAGKAKTEDA